MRTIKNPPKGPDSMTKAESHAAVQKRREELKIRKLCISHITGCFRNMTTERLTLLTDYALSLVTIDEEALQAAEAQAIQACGYNPTENISEHDWAVQQKRNEEALAKEEAAFRAKEASDNAKRAKVLKARHAGETSE